jgi:general secretion pathway protein D
MLKIAIESSSIGQKPAGAVDLVTNKRTITTTVLIEDGGVVVLGGLIEDNSVKGEQRVPFLGNIPLIGLLFKTRNATSTKNNLILFIRPKILRDPSQAAFETDLKYNYMMDQENKLNTREAVPLLPGVSRGKLDAPPPPPPPGNPAPATGSRARSSSGPAPKVTPAAPATVAPGVGAPPEATATPDATAPDATAPPPPGKP